MTCTIDSVYTIALAAIHEVFAWHTEIANLRRAPGTGLDMIYPCQCSAGHKLDSRWWHKELPDFHTVLLGDVVISPETATLELLRKFDILAIYGLLTAYKIQTPSQWNFTMMQCNRHYQKCTHAAMYKSTIVFDHVYALTAAIDYVKTRIAGLQSSDELQNHVDLIQKNNELAAELASAKKQLETVREALGINC